ncbi:MAG: alpha/beta fold hydrolase, partial [Cytophagales bacterium]
MKNHNFSPYFLLKNKHIQTILPVILGKFIPINYNRIRLPLPDLDFIDCDTILGNNSKIIFLIHGLEGNFKAHFIKRLAKKLSKLNCDICAINLRGCSGENNLTFKSYHSGKTDDIDFVINYFLSNKSYESASLVGYSLGANLVLKYIGEKPCEINPIIKKCVAISAPLDLLACSNQLNKNENKFYQNRFLKSLINKVLAKKNKFPNFDYKNHKYIKSLLQFDNWFTAPTFGYESAEDYYKKNSAIHFMESIKTETLLISSKDDPFLDKNCFYDFSNKAISVIYTENGGHVGF